MARLHTAAVRTRGASRQPLRRTAGATFVCERSRPACRMWMEQQGESRTTRAVDDWYEVGRKKSVESGGRTVDGFESRVRGGELVNW